jgi:hypothetical protein
MKLSAITERAQKIRLDGGSFMKKSMMMFVMLGLILAAVPVFADPPPRCDFKIYFCHKSYDSFMAPGADVDVFDGDDGSHVWATYENHGFNSGQYMDAHCNHGTCDITMFQPGEREWKHDYCGNLWIRFVDDYDLRIYTSEPTDCCAHEGFSPINICWEKKNP